MRQVLSISMPTTDIRQMKAIAKKRGYDSVSLYVKQLFKADEDLISEAELLQSVKTARREYRIGKAVRARSLADLV